MKISIKKMLASCIFVMVCLIADNVYAVENQVFTKLFEKYSETTDSFVKAFTSNKWDEALKLAQAIEKQSNELRELGDKDTNPYWKYDATNLHHHSEELIEAIKGKDSVEAVYLVGILVTHIGYIQAANPLWLKEYLTVQLDILEKGINSKDKDATRDAAEIIHTSSNKIVLSAGLQKDLYVHIRWLEDVRKLNNWGDQIIGQVNEGDWAGPKELLPQVKVSFAKWVKSFN